MQMIMRLQCKKGKNRGVYKRPILRTNSASLGWEFTPMQRDFMKTLPFKNLQRQVLKGTSSVNTTGRDPMHRGRVQLQSLVKQGLHQGVIDENLFHLSCLICLSIQTRIGIAYSGGTGGTVGLCLLFFFSWKRGEKNSLMLFLSVGQLHLFQRHCQLANGQFLSFRTNLLGY